MQYFLGVFCFVSPQRAFSTQTQASGGEEQSLQAAESCGPLLHKDKAKLRSSKERIVEGHSPNHGWLVSSSLHGLVPPDNSLVRLRQKVVIDSTQQQSLAQKTADIIYLNKSNNF